MAPRLANYFAERQHRVGLPECLDHLVVPCVRRRTFQSRAAVLIQINARNCLGHSLKSPSEMWRGLLCAFFSCQPSPWPLSPLVRCSSSIRWCSVTPIRPSAHRRASAFPTTGIPITWSDAIGIRRKSMDGATRSQLQTRPSRICHL